MSLANHLWQSTVFAACAALVALSLKGHRAQIRYRMWFAASMKFLAPFSLLTAIGRELAVRTAPPAAPAIASSLAPLNEPFSAPAAAAITTWHAPAIWPAVLLAVWVCGVLAVTARWWTRWLTIRRAIGAASPVCIEASVPVMSSSARIEPGVFGLWRPVLLLPVGIAERLSPVQFRAILAHELCHVRRRDPLAAALHMVVEALFWFHPLVWWIGARLVEERERACDEEVLQRGADPEAYASGILSVCRHYLESPLACAPGVTGADLRKRIESIMVPAARRRLTLARRLALAVAAAAAVAGPVAVGIWAQAPPRFEVATIKKIPGTAAKGFLDILPGGELRLEGVTLKGLIAFAYDISEARISGGPKWIDSDSYQVVGKPEHPSPADSPKRMAAPGTPAWERTQARVRALLTDRFHLVFHKDSKETSGYALVAAKDGPKIADSDESDTRPPGTMRSPGQINGRNGTMYMLAAVLSNALGRPVEDRTGLSGRYTYKLEYAQEAGPAGRGSPDAPEAPFSTTGPSIFAALQEQLGLKLDPAKVAIESIVVDRAEKPTEN